MPLRPLTLEQFVHEAGDAFRRVFASTDPCDAPLREAMSERVILWGSRYKLNETEAAALAEVAASVGDAGFYVTMTERVTAAAWHNTDQGGTFSMLSPGHDQPAKPPVNPPGAHFVPVEVGPQEWYVPLSAIADYLDWQTMPLSTERTHSSHLDRWPALRYTKDGQGVDVPARRLVLEWLADLKTEGGPRYVAGSDPMSWGWLEQLLCHVYGRKGAAELLGTAGITAD